MTRRGAIRAASLLLFLLFWSVAAWLGGDPQLLPYPWQLAGLFWAETLSGELAFHLGMTLMRVGAAFALAMGLGIALGVLMGTRPRVDAWLDPWLIFFLNLPALVLIVLCYLWIGLNEWAAITAVTLNKIPNVTAMIREGARALNPAYRELAQIYALPRGSTLRHVILPQLLPYIAGAARSGIAVIWKIVLVVEFLGRSNGIGFQIHLFFQLFDVGSVLVYAISFIAVMLLIEFVLIQPAERRANHWRTQ